MISTIRIATFQKNRFPTASFRFSLRRTRGIPAASVPLGQMYLQNQGSPWPVKSTTRSGSRITNNTSITYFAQISTLWPGRFFLFLNNGILYSKSCTSPKGHSHPQTNLPNMEPKKQKKSYYIKGKFIIPASQHCLKRAYGA